MASRTQKVLDGGGGGDGKKARPGRGGEEHKKRASEQACGQNTYRSRETPSFCRITEGRVGRREGPREGDMD